MTEAEAYTAKENAKSALLDALTTYIAAAKDADMDDYDQSSEIEDLLSDAGKSWDVLPK